jgi:hypothetical protein
MNRKCLLIIMMQYAYSIVVDSLNLWFQTKIICSASIKKYKREEEEEDDLMDFPAVARSSNLL